MSEQLQLGANCSKRSAVVTMQKCFNKLFHLHNGTSITRKMSAITIHIVRFLSEQNESKNKFN